MNARARTVSFVEASSLKKGVSWRVWTEVGSSFLLEWLLLLFVLVLWVDWAGGGCGLRAMFGACDLLSCDCVFDGCDS